MRASVPLPRGSVVSGVEPGVGYNLAHEILKTRVLTSARNFHRGPPAPTKTL